MTNTVYFHCEDVDKEYSPAWNKIDTLNAGGHGIIRELTTKADDYSYYEKLAKYWGKDDLILIEQDNVVTAEQLKSLIDCPEPACAYWFHNSSKWHAGTLSIGMRLGDPTFNYMLREDAISLLGNEIKYVTFSGTGLTKISKSLQTVPLDRFAQMTRANGMKGKNTDNAIVENINSGLTGTWVRFHLHGQVEHIHEAKR